LSDKAAMTAPLGPLENFPIVGIGASAGGLAALEAFFGGIPQAKSGMAYVVVQHLAPDHDSILGDLIRRFTRMDVFQVEDGMVVRPNSVYVIPPNRQMGLHDGALRLLEPTEPRGHAFSIDFFFRSLAQDQRERAVCIVLSGSGSDGTQGLRAIKAGGGMAVAQKSESAEHDAMPKSAIATGLVDYVLPPAEMGARLAAHTAGQLPHEKGEFMAGADVFQKIMAVLRLHNGHDFSQYKRNTIDRRIERRMAVQQIATWSDYLRYLQATPNEVDALFADLLIGVTQFFRDREAFVALEQPLDALLAAKPARSTLRVWTTGCSTGEEAYSLAMLLCERLHATKSDVTVVVFATDIDRRAIATARAGFYPSTIASDVSAERLSRFFSIEDGGYRIHKKVRDMLVFSEHDLIQDPPFSNLDLISCRNLLIYLSPELQKKLIPLFHYALTTDGLLFLGSSETTGEFSNLFVSLDRKHKLFRHQGGGRRASPPPLGDFLPRIADRIARQPAMRGEQGNKMQSLRDLTERTLLARAPVAALITEHGDLLYLHGQASKYLTPAPGEPGSSLLKMAHEGIRHELENALQRAAATGEFVCYPKLRLAPEGPRTTTLTVQPLAIEAGEPPLFLVGFEEVLVSPASAEPSEPISTEGDLGDRAGRIAVLEAEVRAKGQHLRVTREQMQTSNEQLRASNEELQSTNEELQSTNEELETSKEELQSVNEELATVNAELSTKVSDLSRANNDMNNLLAGTGVGTIFVDHQICIQRFTPAATQLINLIKSDVGRPLAHIASNLSGYDRLVADVQAVLDDLLPREVEVQTQARAWFLLRIRPYRTLENVIEGGVITFTDITQQKLAQSVLFEHEALRRMAFVMRDARDAITVQDLDGSILAWNREATELYGWSEAEALGMNIRSMIPKACRDEALALVRRLSQQEVLVPFRMERTRKDGGTVEISLTATALVNETGAVYAIFTTERELALSGRPAAR